MSISSTDRKAGPYIGNDLTTALPFEFKVFAAGDVRVVRTDLLGAESDLALTTDYTVSLNPDQDSDPGGTVNLVFAAATGYLTTITSQLENLQPVVLTNAGGFYPAVINKALDRLTILIQQLAEKLSRTLTYSISSPLGDSALPTPVANNIIGWNAAANGFQNYPPSDNALLGVALAASSGSSLIGFIQSGSGSQARTVEDTLRETKRLTDKITSADRTANYLAPGSVDLTYAINAWLGEIASGYAIEAPAGRFKFTSALSIPALDNISIKGAGRQKTKFIYAGANTTNDIITIGDGTTSFTGLSLEGFNIDSTTTMTAGTALRIKKQQNGGTTIKDVSFSVLNAPKKLWDGIWFDNTNVTTYKGFEINVQNEGIVVNGAAGVDTGSDLYLDDGTITFANIGVHCAGGFGGLYFGQVLFFGNTTHFKLDNGRVARFNREIILSDLAVFDGCKDYGIYVNDPLASGCNLTINAFIGSAGRIGTGGIGNNIHIASYPASRVTIGSGQIFNATANGIYINDATTLVTVSSNTQINNNGGYGISAGVATTNVNHQATYYNNGSGNTHANIRTLSSFTPTVTNSSAQAITSSGSISWRRDGGLAFFTGQVNITTTSGTSGSVNVSLPFTARGAAVIAGREVLAGKMVQGYVALNATVLNVLNYDNSYPGLNGGILIFSGTCEVY